MSDQDRKHTAGEGTGPAKPMAGPDVETGDAITGNPAGGVSNPAATSTGIGGSGGDARGGVVTGGGQAPAMGGPSRPGPAADVTAGGPATSAGRDAQDPGGTGVTGMGSGAVGHPGGATGGDTGRGRDVPLSDADRAQGVTSAHEVGIVGNAGTAREAGLPGSSGEGSFQTGAHGSGSTSDVPGGRQTITDESSGTVGGTMGEGIGGPAPTSSPEVQAGARGAGARDGGRKDEA